jgi:hypothetical protein
MERMIGGPQGNPPLSGQGGREKKSPRSHRDQQEKYFPRNSMTSW